MNIYLYNFFDYLCIVIFYYIFFKGDYKNCCIYLERHFEAIEKRFGKNSLEVANELDKMTDIMIKNPDIKENW